MIVLDGKKTSQKLRTEIAKEVAEMIDNEIRPPHLVAILVGDDGASQTYVNAKEKACQSVGMTSSVYRLSSKTSEKELLAAVDFLNNDPDVDGFIVQLPLPKHINEQNVIERIDPAKDVDGFHPVNVGKMALGLDCFLPATPNGIIEILKHYQIETEGKHCVVLGRSNIVGSPISIMMSQKKYPGNATVTLCHSKTQNLAEITASADILIVAIGSPEFVKENMVKEGAVVIDVGIHRIASTTTESGFILKGDVDFAAVSTKASHITPVPGGVGPMTIASLLSNTLKAAKISRSI
jgi:methylenetetrahydrofolate dehydrogenase (NADP+)/methenyltetrahydrofolate cyclohydrolase